MAQPLVRSAFIKTQRTVVGVELFYLEKIKRVINVHLKELIIKHKHWLVVGEGVLKVKISDIDVSNEFLYEDYMEQLDIHGYDNERATDMRHRLEDNNILYKGRYIDDYLDRYSTTSIEESFETVEELKDAIDLLD